MSTKDDVFNNNNTDMDDAHKDAFEQGYQSKYDKCLIYS